MKGKIKLDIHGTFSFLNLVLEPTLLHELSLGSACLACTKPWVLVLPPHKLGVCLISTVLALGR